MALDRPEPDASFGMIPDLQPPPLRAGGPAVFSALARALARTRSHRAAR